MSGVGDAGALHGGEGPALAIAGQGAGGMAARFGPVGGAQERWEAAKAAWSVSGNDTESPGSAWRRLPGGVFPQDKLLTPRGGWRDPICARAGHATVRPDDSRSAHRNTNRL